MPSEKRENRKKSHRRRAKKYSRSTERKDEGKKNRDEKDHAKDHVSEIDICNYVNDPAELVSRIFTCLGESYVAESTPTIFKSLRQLELKKLCLRELAMLPNESVISIMHGVSRVNTDNLAKSRGFSSPVKDSRKAMDKKSRKKRRHKSGKKRASSDYSPGSSLDTSSDAASTSSHCALSSSHTPVMENSAKISSPIDPEEGESEDGQEDVAIFEGNESPEGDEVDETDDRESSPKINVAFLQPVPEVTELEYRARAIRSMIANIDKINEKSFERNSIQ